MSVNVGAVARTTPASDDIVGAMFAKRFDAVAEHSTRSGRANDIAQSPEIAVLQIASSRTRLRPAVRIRERSRFRSSRRAPKPPRLADVTASFGSPCAASPPTVTFIS